MRTRMMMVCLAAAVALASLPAQADVVAYYNFDDETANDLSPNANHGVASPGVVYSSDTPSGSGKSFQTPAKGGNFDIAVPTSSSLEAISDQVTVSFWMRALVPQPPNNQWERIIQHANEGGGTQGWLIDRYSTNPRSNMRVDTLGTGGQFNQNIATGGPSTFDDEWHHLVYVLDNGQWKKFVDGVKTSGSYNHGDGFSNTRPLYIGGKNGNAEYVGLLDDVAIYDTALNDELVGMLYAGANPLNIPEPATLSLLGLGALALVRRRRKS